MTRALILWAVLVATAPAYARDDPAAVRPVESIRMPDAEPAIPPSPPAGTPLRLNADNVYVFDADVAVIVRISPPGLVVVTKETGPIRIRDRFADNPSGRKTTRTYRGKEVYVVEAVPGARGLCDVVAIPVGLKDATEIRHRTLDVDGGPGPLPIPPPVPTPTPVPPPVPVPVPVPVPADPLAVPLAAAFAADGSPAAAAKALAGVYRQSSIATDNPALTTLEDLFAVLHAAGQSVAPDPALARVRRVIADELNAKIGRNPAAPLDAATRANAKAQFTRMAALLEVLK